MRKIRNRRKDDAVSPVIATILMVAITVVLAAVLYVMVMGMTSTQQISQPLGLNQQSKTASTVNILISSAPDGATTDGASISYTHGGTPAGVTATLYNAAGTVVATYTNGAFTPATGTDPVTLTSGMTLVISPTSGSVSAGDVITISSSQNTFSTSTITVS